jgi:hypothetical protein
MFQWLSDFGDEITDNFIEGLSDLGEALRQSKWGEMTAS